MKKDATKISGTERVTLKPQEVAKLLGIGKNRIYVALENGDIPSIMIAGRRLVPRAVLDRMLSGVPVA